MRRTLSAWLVSEVKDQMDFVSMAGVRGEGPDGLCQHGWCQRWRMRRTLSAWLVSEVKDQMDFVSMAGVRGEGSDGLYQPGWCQR